MKTMASSFLKMNWTNNRKLNQGHVSKGKYAKESDRTATFNLFAICALVIATTVTITSVCQRMKYESKITEINASHEQEIINLRAELNEEHETQIAELKQFYEYGGDVAQIEKEAEYIAKVIYGMDRNHADSDRKAIVWCILNRVEHHSHPDTVQGVCEQAKQWMGYSPENPVLADFYDLALEELKIWYSGGHRPMSNKYIYLTWSSKEILLRDTFEENKKTNYWRMQ